MEIDEELYEHLADENCLESISTSFELGLSTLFIAKGNMMQFSGDAILNPTNIAGVREFVQSSQSSSIKHDDVDVSAGSAICTRTQGRFKSKYAIHVVCQEPSITSLGDEIVKESNQQLLNGCRNAIERASEIRDIKTIGICLLPYIAGKDKSEATYDACSTIMGYLIELEKKLDIFLIASSQEELEVLDMMSNYIYPDLVSSIEAPKAINSSSSSSSSSTVKQAKSTPLAKGNKSSSKTSKKGFKTLAQKHHLESVLSSYQLGKSTLYIAGGSVVEFAGDVLVNAANNGGLGGGGIDGMFNMLGGIDFQRERHNLKVVARPGVRILTGDAVYTKARGHLKGKYVVHAVGPDYNEYQYDEEDSWDEPDTLLSNAYKRIIEVSTELKNVNSVGCCLLSAGIFSGNRGKQGVLYVACKALMEALHECKSNIDVFLIGYTEEEQELLQVIAEYAFEEIQSAEL